MKKLVPFLLVALAACGDSTGPGTTPDTSLSGRWSYLAPDLAHPQQEITYCVAQNFTVDLQHEGTVLRGTTSTGGTFTCYGPNGWTQTVPLNPFQVSGTVNGSTLNFTLAWQNPETGQNTEATHVATLRNGRIEGNVEFGRYQPGTFVMERR